MKTLLFVGLIALSGNLFAETQFDRGTERYKRKTFKCIRKVMEKRIGGKKIITQSAGLLKELVDASYTDKSEVKKVYKKCKGLKKNLGGVSVDYLTYQSDIKQLGEAGAIEAEFAKALDQLLMGYYTCKFKAIEAHLVSGIGAGVGLGAGTCRGKNGKQFVMTAPQLSFDAGLGAFLIGGQYEIKFTNSKQQFEIHSNSYGGHLLIGLGYAASADGGNELETLGVGAGVGLAVGVTGILPLKLMPLKSNFDSIDTLLFN